MPDLWSGYARLCIGLTPDPSALSRHRVCDARLSNTQSKPAIYKKTTTLARHTILTIRVFFYLSTAVASNQILSKMRQVSTKKTNIYTWGVGHDRRGPMDLSLKIKSQAWSTLKGNRLERLSPSNTLLHSLQKTLASTPPKHCKRPPPKAPPPKMPRPSKTLRLLQPDAR